MRQGSTGNARTYLTTLLMGLVCFGVLTVTSTHVFALDETQQTNLDKAETVIKNAGADLDAARGSAGTVAKPAKGSRAKLTAMRLDSARERLKEAAELLGELPADDDAVKSVQEKHDAVTNGVSEVQAIITPKTEPEQEPSEDTGEATAPAVAATAEPASKLHYTQEKLVKDANWYVRETNNYADAAAAVVAQMDAEGPKPVHSEVRAALNSIDTGKKKHALAVDYINQLPADHPQVKPTADAVKRAGDRLGALESRLRAEDVKLAKLTGMEHYPNFEQDFTLLQDLGRRYYDFHQTMQQPEKLAQVVAEDGQVLAEIQRIAKTYLPLVEQRTPQGERVEQQFGHFQTQRNKFAAELVAYKQELPALFEADLKEVTDLADEGVAKNSSMYFGKNSGVEQRFGWAEQKLLVMRAFSEEEAKPYAERLEQVREEVRQRAKSLEAQIIANNPLPDDNFEGEDRDVIVQLATDAWAKQQPGAEVLTVRIPSQAWARDTRWQWSNGAFYKIDSSSVQVQLLIKHDDKLAVVRPINLYKNHLKADTLTASPMDTIDEDLIPQRYVVRDKLQQ